MICVECGGRISGEAAIKTSFINMDGTVSSEGYAHAWHFKNPEERQGDE